MAPKQRRLQRLYLSILNLEGKRENKAGATTRSVSNYPPSKNQNVSML